VLLVCAGLINLLLIIYKGHSPSLVRARSQEEIEVVFACALCYTGLIGARQRSDGASSEVKCDTGLTGDCYRSDRWTLTTQVLGDEKLKSVVSPIQPPPPSR
jgi:hypothetical protein